MLSRLFSVLFSMLLLGIVGGFTVMLVPKYSTIRNSTVIWQLFLILLPVNGVILWLSWKAIARLSRYGAHPFQVRRTYQVRLFEQIDASLGPVVIEGSALLIVRSTVAGAQIQLRDVEPSDWKFQRTFPHGQREVDFLLENAGAWSATLSVKAPRIVATSFRLLHTTPDDGVLATLELEIRGHCRILQLPQYLDEPTRGFPVVVRNTR